ncbi:MAG: hypothetical protein KJ607_13045, partial [Bacteroidetes bacterium]|nr:hypothetical protein [Bacteroidota bacterium]
MNPARHIRHDFLFPSMVVLLLGIICAGAQSQNAPATDSLVQLIEQSSHDSVRAALLLELGDQYETNDPDKAMEYY